MSRIITILIFVLPVSIIGFGAFVTGEGGKKKKEKKEAKQAKAEAQPESAQPIADYQEDVAEVPAESAQQQQLADVELAEVTIEHEDLWEEWTEPMNQEVEFWRERVFVSDDLSHVIDKEILKPIAKAKGVKLDVMSFSRCPSGLETMVLQKPGSTDAYYYGIVVEYVGCSDEMQCKFRIDPRNGEIGISSEKITYDIWHARDMKTAGESYVSVSEWISGLQNG